MLKTKIVNITAEGRDKGKSFLLTEMPAVRAEKWAFRALGAMAKSGFDIPPHIVEMGIAGVVAVGLKAILGTDWQETEPLLDELMSCVKSVQPAAAQGRPLVDEDIEEVKTLLTLKSEVLELHAGFSVAAYLLKTWEAAGVLMKLADGQRTQTSTEGSGSSSRPS